MHTLTKLPEDPLSHFSNKTPIKLIGSDIESKRLEILDYFHSTFSIYEELFSFIKDEGYYIRSEPLRHPLIFYFGHTATFIINKLIISGFKIQRINPYFESIFAVGVDEMSWDDLNNQHYKWPTVQELKEYRLKVRNFFDNFLKNLDFNLPLSWESPMYIALMICEHERIHLETSSVIMRRLPLEYFVEQPKNWRVCEETRTDINSVPENKSIKILEQKITMGKKDDYYGWDNEYGTLTVDVKEFSVDKFLTTNKDYLYFIQDNGYQTPELWTDEGKKWLRYQELNRPIFWSENLTKLRLFNKEIDMPWDWPVEVNYLEAKAYCNWRTLKTGTYTRMLIEPEWCVLRGDNELDGNINLKYYSSSCPVDKFKHNHGVYDLVGNVWQWTETPLEAFTGFKVHPSYKDFSTPTFDGKHNVIKGGSWISTGNETILSSRYAFRRHFYQHAGFRCVQGEEIKYEDIRIEEDPDVTKWISAEYDKKMYEKFKLRPYTETIAEEIQKFAYTMEKKENFSDEHTRALVLGCKTGGISFELTNQFHDVIGMDQTAFHFKVGVDLTNGSKIKYKVREEGGIFVTKEIDLNLSHLNSAENKKIEFYQTDLYNDIDTNKHKKFNVILVANVDDIFSIDGNSLENNLQANGLVFVMVPKGRNLKECQFPSRKFKKLNIIENTLNPIDHKILFKETARKHRIEVYELQIFKYEKRENSESYYESDFLCEQYVRLHYANNETFPTTCAKLCLKAMKNCGFKEDSYKKALDLGCALGQTSIYLSEKFEYVFGVDYSRRFIEIANERKTNKNLKNVDFVHGSVLELEKIPGIQKDNILVFCGNLIDRLTEPRKFLDDIGDYIVKGGLLVLTSPYTWLEDFTPEENWLGGVVHNGEIISTILGLEMGLKEKFEKISVEDVDFCIPDYPPFSHQMTTAELSVWMRK